MATRVQAPWADQQGYPPEQSLDQQQLPVQSYEGPFHSLRSATLLAPSTLRGRGSSTANTLADLFTLSNRPSVSRCSFQLGPSPRSAYGNPQPHEGKREKRRREMVDRVSRLHDDTVARRDRYVPFSLALEGRRRQRSTCPVRG
jgi:hypothetical protein